jgi:hypothetical protein
MSETPTKPRLVKCRCHYCEGDIEFDAKGFNEGDNCTLTCPHCQTETTATIPPLVIPPPVPPTIEEIEKAKQAELEKLTIQKIVQVKSMLRARLESGKPVFLFDSVYVPVDSKLLDDEFADEFNVSLLRKLGLLGWDVVQVVPRTIGIGLQNRGTDTWLSEAWGGGVGGNVMGVHIIIKKTVSASDFTDDPADEVGNFIRNHLEDFLGE